MAKWQEMPCRTCKGKGRIASYDLKGFTGYVTCGHCQGSGVEPQPARGCVSGGVTIVVALLALAAFLNGDLTAGFLLLGAGALWLYTT